MKSARVRLADRSYDVRFQPLQALAPYIKSRKWGSSGVFVVTARALQKSGHFETLVRSLQARQFRVSTAVVPNGEGAKNLSTIARLYSLGFKAGLDRKSLVIGLGGGVVTDMAAFMASTYMRGIDYLSVPTTLLGMVDAAIGGKTGVDVPEGKNLIGSFWQPKAVWVDLRCLTTLPERHWKTGFAEITKYGVILKPRFFQWLEDRIARQPQFSRWAKADIARAVMESTRTKAQVVSADERETPLGGMREILNFGHTAGHALEAATGYGRYSHGEAISIGMAVAGELSLGRRLWSSHDHDRLVRLLGTSGLPTQFEDLTAAERGRFWQALARDKKHVSGELRFVLPTQIGRVRVVSGISQAEVAAALRARGFDPT